MKKMLIGTLPFNRNRIQKTWLIMRLTIFLTLIFVFRVSASVYSQQTKLSLKLDEVSLEQAFTIIHQQTGYDFFYKTDQIPVDRKVSADYKNLKVEVILSKILQGTNLSFYVLDKDIVISPKRENGSMLSQQIKTVTGKVTDSSGEALPGVTVLVKGTTQGTVTDFDGNYTISEVPTGGTLIFSFVGMRTEEIVVGSQASINVMLEEDAIGLEEVIAVGYAVQEKVSLTNSVAQIKGDDLVKRPVANVGQSLQGMAPGVIVTDNGGRPGSSDVNIRIRGLTSLGDKSPLIIVDGIEQRMSDINPDDIESVSVLKDASSTAIYGSRAANGVVLITTRRAKTGDVNIAYHGYVGIQKATNTPEHLDLRSYFELENVARVNAGAEPKYTEEYIDEYVNATDREKYPLPFPWFDKGVMLKNAPQQNHTLSISGGNEFLKARASIRHQDIGGIVSNFGDKKNEVRVNTDFKASEKLDFSFDLNFRASENKQPYAGVYNVFNYMLHATKFSVPQYETGEYGLGPQNNNPLIFAELSGLTTSKNDYFIGKGKANYEIVSGLKYTFELGVRNSSTQTSAYQNKYRNEDPYTGRIREVPLNSLSESRSNFREYTLSHLLNYSKSFERHNINFLLGYSTIANRQNSLSGFRQDFYNNDIQSLSSGSEENKDNGGSNSEYGLRSYFGRANYNYAKKYFVEVNARYDGSSRFSSTKQYAFFPSFSGAWRISQEDFWSDYSGIVNEFKLRASWGLTGNQAISLYEFYPALSTVDYAFNENPAQGYTQTQFVNKDLTWEKTEQWDIGIDLGFLDNRINFTLDYYDKLTRDILLQLPIPATIGLNPSYQNAGVVSNKGWETGINYRGGNKLKYNLGLNVSRNKNVVEDLLETGPYISGGGANQTFIIQEGMAMNSLWGYQTDGFFQSEEEIANYPTLQANTKPGDVKYLNLNNDDVISPEDRGFLGYSFPIYNYGATMNFSYFNFELYMQWQGASGHTTQVAGGLAHQATYEAFTHKIHADYWTEENRDARWPRPIKSNLRNLQASDLLTIDADYLRLKNIMLSYNLPAIILSKLSISKAQVYVNATNVLTLSKLNEWDLDPETPPGRANYYPQVSLYTVGLKLNF
ncbi:TonB-dependent receptor [uncultured Sunxiuqinia sp.]|uniref:TonB-dependent receptor n=1 Tax=uncultured Sunxiuqinia sp. TaxID=1573825 RepID=UPI00263259E0|nr:TonB-dependent receptor [uncultured Sunxiuqinia sp.]